MNDIELSDENIIEIDPFHLDSTGINGPFISITTRSCYIHLNKEDLLKLNKLFGITNKDIIINN
jgi:hypothetical protein